MALFSKTRLLSSSLAVFCFSASCAFSEVLVDFGGSGNQSTQGADLRFWNNVTEVTPLPSVPLFDAANAVTGFTLTVTSRFNAVNTNGTTTSSLPYPTSATADSLFGNTEIFGGLSNLTPTFDISGLNPSSTYNFTFFASRTGVADTRTTDYTVTGSNSGFTTLNVSNNVNTTVSVLAISPTAGGVITIALTPSATNNNASHFVYLGTLEFAASPIPEPMTASLVLSGAMLLALRRKRIR